MPDVPTERELQALKVLWGRKNATVREIAEAIREQGETLAYTTVLSLLQVMEQKGLVGHSAEGKVYSYFAKVRREPTFRRLARGFLDTVFDGAMDEYLVHALESRKLTAAELTRMEELIAQARRQRGETAAKPPETPARETPVRETPVRETQRRRTRPAGGSS